MSIPTPIKQLSQEMQDLLSRSMDSHVRIAVTGLSRAGKTAFISSLVNQLLHASTHEALPLLEASREKRIIGARREPQTNLMVPRFAYDEAMRALYAEQPDWPLPTRDVSEIRLALKYKPKKRSKKLLGSSATLNIDIIDYPGEWLLDLPLLEMDFDQWSEQQFAALKGERAQLAEPWLSQLAQFSPQADADEDQLAALSAAYTDYLHACKAAGLHWVQPGRFVLPGDLTGAPVLQFFPYVEKEPGKQVNKDSQLAMLRARYHEYQTKVVKAFYKHHFATFDRQIVLVDCLQPLNAGADAFHDMRGALEQLMGSFRYGKSHLLRRLFSPTIDKILFAATKADHVTPDQHPHLVSLLGQMVYPAWQATTFENIEMQCLSIASVQATQPGFVTKAGTSYPALRGVDLGGEPQTIYPGEVPRKLPGASYWQQHGFEFTEFRPQKAQLDAPLPHIRMDKVLQFLLGDKLK